MASFKFLRMRKPKAPQDSPNFLYMYTCAGEENAFNIKEATVTLAAGFYSVGAALGLPPFELNKIRKNCPHDCDEALFQVIIAWLKQLYDTSKHGHPSWKKLVKAIASEAGGQHPALARKIAAAHRGKVKSVVHFSVVLTSGLCLQPVGNGSKVMMKVFHDQSNPILKMVRKLCDILGRWEGMGCCWQPVPFCVRVLYIRQLHKFVSHKLYHIIHCKHETFEN